MDVDMGIEYNTRIYRARTLECHAHSYTLDVTWESTFINVAMTHTGMPLVAIHRFYIHMDTRIK